MKFSFVAVTPKLLKSATFSKELLEAFVMVLSYIQVTNHQHLLSFASIFTPAAK
jgi:hypothetical protein